MWVGRRELPHLNLLLHDGSNNPQGEHAVRDLQVFGKLWQTFEPTLTSCVSCWLTTLTLVLFHIASASVGAVAVLKFASMERELEKEHLKPSSNSIQIIDEWGCIPKNWIKPAGLAWHPDIKGKFDFITGHTLAPKLDLSPWYLCSAGGWAYIPCRWQIADDDACGCNEAGQQMVFGKN